MKIEEPKLRGMAEALFSFDSFLCSWKNLLRFYLKHLLRGRANELEYSNADWTSTSILDSHQMRALVASATPHHPLPLQLMSVSGRGWNFLVQIRVVAILAC